MTEFQLLDIWSKFRRKVTVSYYTQSRACTVVMRVVKLNIYSRGAPDPDPDPAGYPVNFVDPDPAGSRNCGSG